MARLCCRSIKFLQRTYWLLITYENMLMVFAQNKIGGWAFVIKLLMGEIPNFKWLMGWFFAIFTNEKKKRKEKSMQIMRAMKINLRRGHHEQFARHILPTAQDRIRTAVQVQLSIFIAVHFTVPRTILMPNYVYLPTT